jgi:NitT/TauT family transport system ATP-binding protein
MKHTRIGFHTRSALAWSAGTGTGTGTGTSGLVELRQVSKSFSTERASTAVLDAVSMSVAPVRRPGPERGVVFQQPMLFPWLNVLDNVTFGPRMSGASAAGYGPRAQHTLDLVGLRGFEQHLPHQLSGGMRQRVALARAWLPNPRVLLMDEPFGALDAQTRLMMQELLTSVWEATHTTLLFITHDVDEAIALGDRVLMMSARPGHIAREWKVPFERPRSLEDIVADPRFGDLKREVLLAIRREARAAMAVEAAR